MWLQRKKINSFIAIALAISFSWMPMPANAAIFTNKDPVQKQAVLQTEQAYHQGVVQQTKYGTVSGLQDGAALSWQGIPYAKAPIGDLRWKAPQEPEAWAGIFQATKNGNVGIQGSKENIQGSEDCLNLSIYRPNSQEAGLPVLVYIHGGNNQSGTNKEIAPGKLAVNANCIVVSLNYRLGLLGFNSLPALKTGGKLEDSGNYTLLDFARALDWLKDNAESFGGNSDNITISGFSAGGRDVMAMLASPVFKNKYQKAISFSGGMTTADPAASSKIIAKALAPLAVEDGVKTSLSEAEQWLLQDMQDVRDYLYGLSAERLAASFGNARIRMSGFPHLYSDGTVLPKEGFATTSYNEVPLIMLTGTNEFSAFSLGDPYFVKAQNNQTLLSDPKTRKELAFVIKYGSEFYRLFNTEESAIKMIDSYKAPIYTCAVQWGGNKSIVGDEMAELVGATHGIFLPFLTDEAIGVREKYPQAFNNQGAKDLTKKFQKYISNFLWTGNPNSEGLVMWEAWKNKQTGPRQLLFDANRDHAIIKMSYGATSYDAIIKEIEEDQTISQKEKDEIIKKVLNGRWFSKNFDKHFGNENLWIN